jgi:hypothetical protein
MWLPPDEVQTRQKAYVRNRAIESGSRIATRSVLSLNPTLVLPTLASGRGSAGFVSAGFFGCAVSDKRNQPAQH